jgi:6-phosphogluconolactonase (cycloisomerase 2 family)
MKKAIYGSALLALMVAGAVQAQTGFGWNDGDLIVTASNTASNALLVYNTGGQLVEQVKTGGAGGVSGNAGGIAQNHDLLAVVNYGSGNVSIFRKSEGRHTLQLEKIVPASSNPVSVAFGRDHLYILSATHIESHPIDRSGVASNADGEAKLVIADGSAAQVGVLEGQLVITEKSNAIETVNVTGQGAVTGATTLVANIPANVNAPFGLATRGNDAYVTIAHANEISLVRDNAVLTVTGSGTQMAPCWVTLDGPFLFSANSPSKSVSRYAVYGQKIVQDAAVVATFNGDPADITYRDSLAAVVDANGSVSHVSVFHVDGDGNFNLKSSVTINNIATNGIAIVHNGSNHY